MVVCICANVSERELRAVIADGATTTKEVARRCGAGAGCGACRPFIRESIRQCRVAAEAAAVAAADSASATSDAAAL
jgi:bacterioferritin-associated ferredoxin